MTIEQFDKKINQLKSVKSKATGIRLMKLGAVIDDLETARVTVLISDLVNLDLSNDDVEKLHAIADAFDSATADISNANNLINTAINIGKRLVSLVS